MNSKNQPKEKPESQAAINWDDVLTESLVALTRPSNKTEKKVNGGMLSFIDLIASTADILDNSKTHDKEASTSKEPEHDSKNVTKNVTMFAIRLVDDTAHHWLHKNSYDSLKRIDNNSYKITVTQYLNEAMLFASDKEALKIIDTLCESRVTRDHWTISKIDTSVSDVPENYFVNKKIKDLELQIASLRNGLKRNT